MFTFFLSLHYYYYLLSFKTLPPLFSLPFHLCVNYIWNKPKEMKCLKRSIMAKCSACGKLICSASPWYKQFWAPHRRRGRDKKKEGKRLKPEDNNCSPSTTSFIPPYSFSSIGKTSAASRVSNLWEGANVTSYNHIQLTEKPHSCTHPEDVLLEWFLFFSPSLEVFSFWLSLTESYWVSRKAVSLLQCRMSFGPYRGRRDDEVTELVWRAEW